MSAPYELSDGHLIHACSLLIDMQTAAGQVCGFPHKVKVKPLRRGNVDRYSGVSPSGPVTRFWPVAALHAL